MRWRLFRCAQEKPQTVYLLCHGKGPNGAMTWTAWSSKELMFAYKGIFGGLYEDSPVVDEKARFLVEHLERTAASSDAYADRMRGLLAQIRGVGSE